MAPPPQDLVTQPARLETLLEVSRQLSRIQPLETLLANMAEACGHLLDSDSVGIRVVDGDDLVLSAVHGDAQQAMPTPRIKIGASFTGIVVETGKPLVVRDPANDPRLTPAHREAYRRGGYRAFLGVPLKLGEQILGVLSIRTRREHGFSPEDLGIVTAFAAQAAIAIENARLYRQSEERAEKLKTFTALSRLMTSAQDSSQVCEAVARAATTLLTATTTRVWVSDPVGRVLRPQGSFGTDPAVEEAMTDFPVIPYGQGLVGRIVESRTPEFLLDIGKDPRWLNRRLATEGGLQSFAGVPLIADSDIVGVLAISFRERRCFTSEERELIALLADQAAIAIRNARLYSETEHRRSVAEWLSDIGRLISQSLESEIIGQKIVEGLRVLLGARTSALYRVDPASRDLRARASAGEIGPLAVLPAGTGLAGLAVRKAEPVMTPSVATDPRVVLPPIGREQIERELARSALAVPLRIQGAIVGVLTVGDREGRIFSDDDVRLAQVFADQAVLAIENARLHEEARTHLTRTQTLLAIGQTVGTTLDLTETLRRVATETRQALGADMVGAYLADGDERILRSIAGSGVPTHLAQAFRDFPLPLKGHRFVENAWEHRQTAWSDDAEADPRIDREVLARFPHGSLAFVPMIEKGRPIGGLFLVWWTRRPALTPDEVLLAEGICRHAAIAVGNARLYDETSHTLEELRATQEQLIQAQKMEAIGQLAGGIAHDFNNLLTVIIGRSQLLGRDPRAADSVRRGLEIIDKSAKTAANLTRQLVAFSRKQVLQPQVLDLNTVVSGTNEMLRRLIGEDIPLVTVLDPAIGRVKADPGQIEQILMNLAVNARDAMPAGGRLTIETANVELDAPDVGRHVGACPEPHIMLAVSDTGVGMSRETQAHVFEPFFTTREVGKGTGLGLSTVYGIVKQSGGWIRVYSEPGAGATFKIYFPRVRAPAEPAEGAITTSADVPRGSETILLVEDEGEVRALARDILQARGYTVLEAPDGAEALRFGQRHAGVMHLMLTDVVMPGINGPELANRLVALRPGMAVLYMSGYTDNAAVHHGVLDSGAAFLPKPIAPDALVRKVRELLDQRTLTAVNSN